MSSEPRGRTVRLACLVAVLATTSGASTADEPVRLNATPGTCVALHKGQTCFRRVRLDWDTPDDGRRYCLGRDGDAEPLLCWRGRGSGRHEHDYASATAERYTLARGEGGEPLADAVVRTAWVHRSNRRGAGGWRLF